VVDAKDVLLFGVVAAEVSILVMVVGVVILLGVNVVADGT